MNRLITSWQRTFWLLPVAAVAPSVLPTESKATTVAQVCAFGANTCAAGVATINSRTVITSGSVLDFRAAGFPRVDVKGTGALKLEVLENDKKNCPLAPTTTMSILAGQLAIRTPTATGGGEVTGDNTNLAGVIQESGRFNGGSIWIDLDEGSSANGSLLIEPGGRLTSDRLGRKGKGRGGDITVTADGQIWVRANGAGGPPRGIISANSQSSSRAMFEENCGRTEITLLANGNAIVGPPIETVIIEGDVQIISPPSSGEGFIGGVITVMAGSEPSKLTLPPFPTSNPPKNPANPLQNGPQNNGTFFLTSTGAIQVDAKDSGGAEVHVYDCVAIVNGLIQVGGLAPSLTQILGREQDLPNLLSITSNESTTIDMGGKLLATLRQGYKQHLGQGPLCAFTPITPPKANGPTSKTDGGADVCLITRGDLLIDGTLVAHGPSPFAVENDVSGGSQTAGTSWVLTTQDGNVDLLGRALSSNGLGVGAKGGMMMIQSDADTNLGDLVTAGIVEAKGTGGPGSGGSIQVEAVSGALKGGAAGSKLESTGTNTVRSCQAVTGFPPSVTLPPFIALAPSCGSPVMISPVPSPLPCGSGCFCLQSHRLQGGVLTVTGQGLEGVTVLEVNATSCNPGTGTALVIQAPKEDSKITASFAGALIPGRRIVLSNPAGPSSACSLPIP